MSTAHSSRPANGSHSTSALIISSTKTASPPMRNNGATTHRQNV